MEKALSMMTKKVKSLKSLYKLFPRLEAKNQEFKRREKSHPSVQNLTRRDDPKSKTLAFPVFPPLPLFSLYLQLATLEMIITGDKSSLEKEKKALKIGHLQFCLRKSPTKDSISNRNLTDDQSGEKKNDFLASNGFSSRRCYRSSHHTFPSFSPQ